MQFQRDGTEIVKLFTGLKPHDHLVIIPKRTGPHGWIEAPDAPDYLKGDEPIHMMVSSVQGPGVDEDPDVDDPFEYVPGDPVSYSVLAQFMNAELKNDMWSLLAALLVRYDEETGQWEVKFTLIQTWNYYIASIEITDVIHSIVNYGGAKVLGANALPALCGGACAARSRRLEKERSEKYLADKANFYSVLARRFGDTIAADLQYATFPELDDALGHLPLHDA